MTSLSRFAFTALICISAFACTDLAQAKGQTEVSKDAVLAACRHTSGCSYDTDSNTGETAGCSPHACFYCKGTTCHQTSATREIAGLKPKKVDAATAVTSQSQIVLGSTHVTQSQNGPSMAIANMLSSTTGLQQSIH